jgi:hypothetical protein
MPGVSVAKKKENNKRKWERNDKKMRSGFRTPQWPSTGKGSGRWKIAEQQHLDETEFHHCLPYRSHRS